MKRIVLVGASGAFGARLAERLARLDGVTLVLAARGRPALERLRHQLAPTAAATLEIAAFDRHRAGALAALGPDIVVDASGPFQSADLGLPRAALAAGAHYVDLADGRDFVRGFAAALDGEARVAGRAAITGASSSPALTHAVVETLTAGWRRLDVVRAAILPGARAPKGLSVVRATLSWTGRPVRVWEDGRWRDRPGWSGLSRVTVPGLGRRWASLAETPDLDLLVERFKPARSARFEASLAPGPLHLGLWSLGWLGPLGLPLPPLAATLRGAARLIEPFGDDRGGLWVLAEGVDAGGRAARARYSLVAEAGEGPRVPGLPAAAVVRRLLNDETSPGARVCVGLLSVDDILAEAEGLSLSTRIDRVEPHAETLFQAVLGPAFDALPDAVRAVHGRATAARWAGRGVARGSGGLAAIVRAVLRLPRPGRGPVSVEITPGPARHERWTRRFTGGGLSSRLTPSPDGFGFEERIGPLAFGFEPVATRRGLRWQATGWRLGALRLPLALAPRTRALCSERDGGYRFSAVVAHPWLGVLFAYAGRLAPG